MNYIYILMVNSTCDEGGQSLWILCLGSISHFNMSHPQKAVGHQGLSQTELSIQSES